MNAIMVGDERFEPSKVVCVGRNYVEHIHELNNTIPDSMVLFHKTNSSICHQLNAFAEEPLHYETEICFVVKDKQYYAVGLGLDLTKRELQSELKNKGLPWERAKAFDGSAVLSRFILLEGVDIANLSLELLINSVRVQCGHVEQMIYSPQIILQEIQTYTSLYDGDVIMTGTPKGVGVVHAEDQFVARLKQGDTILLEVEWKAV